MKGNIWKFYLYQTLSGMFFSVPVMVLFWQDNGLSLTEVMILQSIFAILAVILEVPTGYYADVHGRKKALVLAGITGFIAISVYSTGHNFFHFLIGEVFFAFSMSFTSGTTGALLFDTLKSMGMEERYKEIWGKALYYSMIALAVSNVAGGLIAKIDLRYTLYASIPFFALMIPVAISMQEPERHKPVLEEGYVSELIRIVRFEILKKENLKWLIIYSGIVYAFNQAVLWLYQPYFKISELDVAYFGIVFAGFQLVSAFSSKYAYIIESRLGRRYSLAILIFLVAVSYFLMSGFVFIFSFIFCFIQQFVRGFKNTVIADYINRLTTSDIRATVLSAESFAGRLFYAAIIPVFGWIADVYTVIQALTVMGITALVTGIVFIFVLRKNLVI